MTGLSGVAFAIAMMLVGDAEKQMQKDYTKMQLSEWAAMKDTRNSQMAEIIQKGQDQANMDQEIANAGYAFAAASLVCSCMALGASGSKPASTFLQGLGQSVGAFGQAYQSQIKAGYDTKLATDDALGQYFQTNYSNQESLRKQMMDFLSSNQQNIDSVYSQLSKWQDSLSQAIRWTV